MHLARARQSFSVRIRLDPRVAHPRLIGMCVHAPSKGRRTDANIQIRKGHRLWDEGFAPLQSLLGMHVLARDQK